MNFKPLRSALLAVGIVSFLAFPRPGQGAPTVYFARDDSTALMMSFPNSQAKFNQFTATLNSFGVDTIETIDVGPPTFGANPQLSFGATGITANTQGVIAVEPPFAGFSIDAKSLSELDAATMSPAVDTIFSFNQYITAFGLFVIQGGDGEFNDNPTTFRLRDTATNAFVDVPVQVGPDWGFNNVFFLGVTDLVPFNEVSILETNDLGDGMVYDNIVAGNVPEPGTLVLMMLGAACALCRAARFRRR
jgi:hypothetical protein